MRLMMMILWRRVEMSCDITDTDTHTQMQRQTDRQTDRGRETDRQMSGGNFILSDVVPFSENPSHEIIM